ncbi:MAG TPA: HlyD family efflux transporter periplasmic adaptor subunit [Chitinophagaceae bacterium]|jgi:HlyD family secretion protein|nr:HlyD family efflux transporter periplasmic adaptor subunit [Chitinophagaceae bacterium]
MKTLTTAFFLLATCVVSCTRDKQSFDASGTFETEETLISSEVSGTIKQFDVAEGQLLQAGQLVGFIDSMQLYLKKKQLEAQIRAVLSRRPDIPTQLASSREQLKAAEREQSRISNMVQADAATPKQLDDINAQVIVLKKQIEAQSSTLGLSSHSINQEILPIQAQVEQLEDQLAKCRIINPVNGTVLTKYTELHEVITPGKPLYQVADLSTLTLRSYVTGDQFSNLKLNQQVQVSVDNGPGKYKQYEGFVYWISNKAEFTPKTIQTKDERANLVYAVKIRVKNDGLLKIGMYGEVNF